MATNQMRREAAKRKLARQQERRVEQARRRRRIAVITSVAVVVVVVVGVVLLTTLPKGDASTAAAPASDAATATSTPAAAAQTPAAKTPAAIPTAITPLPTRPTPLPATVNCAYPAEGQAAKPATVPAGTGISAAGTVAVNLKTSAGAVPLTLSRALAPCTVNSFVSLAQQGYFNDTPCHRLTTDPGLQVLQCGDPSGSGSGGPGYTIPDEVFPQLTYGRGLLAMANTGQPNTGGSQFFMIYGDGQLPPQYTVFGSISAEGLQVLDTIAKKGQDGSFDAQAGGGKPIEPVTIQAATVG